MNVFVTIVKILAFAVAVSVWCTFGLAVWIALVCRVTAAATFRITATLIASSGRGSIEPATKSIEEAAAMWCRGAIAIARSFFGKDGAYAEGADSPNLRRVLQEFGFAVIFYGSILFFYNGLHVLKDFSKFDDAIKKVVVMVLNSWAFWVLCALLLVFSLIIMRHPYHNEKQEVAKSPSPDVSPTLPGGP